MSRRVFLLAHFQFSKLMQPGQRSFDIPTRLSQAAAVSRATLGQDRLYPLFDRFAMGFGIISTSSLNVVGATARSPSLSFEASDFVEQREQLRNFVTVRLGKNDGQRDAVGIGKHMVLASQFAPIRGIWAGFCASARSTYRGAIDQGAILVDLVGCLKFGQQTFEDILPDTSFVPMAKMAPAGLPRGKIAGCRKPAPGNAGAEHEEDPRKDAAWLCRFSSRELPMPVTLLLGNPRFQAFQRSSDKMGLAMERPP